jgi:hypothetical protein
MSGRDFEKCAGSTPITDEAESMGENQPRTFYDAMKEMARLSLEFIIGKRVDRALPGTTPVMDKEVIELAKSKPDGPLH